ncbi:hypothetical protein GCM10023147_45720 [Tsukamurella soli]|uniref:Uncharacterized protein n=1 Tax=Tsukamurella soli TaxID=644556 RepID=A0ABP8KDE6_9ACTN
MSEPAGELLTGLRDLAVRVRLPGPLRHLAVCRPLLPVQRLAPLPRTLPRTVLPRARLLLPESAELIRLIPRRFIWIGHYCSSQCGRAASVCRIKVAH